MKDDMEVIRIKEELLAEPEGILYLLEEIEANKSAYKYVLEKAIRKASDDAPSALIPYIDEIARLLLHPNSFIKWGGIIILANLLAVVDIAKAREHLETFLELLEDSSMITAANVVGGCSKLVKAHPELEPLITSRLLDIQNNTYYNKKEVSPECKNVLYGHLLEAFGEYYSSADDKKGIDTFVEKCLSNSRKAVVKKAEEFIATHKNR